MRNIVIVIVLIILIITFGVMVKRKHSVQVLENCLHERNSLLKKLPKEEGTYIPQCTLWGNYLSQQCNDATDMCWCVTPKGKKIANTEARLGQQPEQCRLNWFVRWYQRLQF